MPVTPAQNSSNLLVLHTLRCIGLVTLPRVAEAAGRSEEEAESELLDLAVAGLVTRTPGEFGGWGLTEAGRAVDAEGIAAELSAAGMLEAVSQVFDRFLELNPELLDLCRAWQSRTRGGVRVMNDHTDSSYDARLLHRLAEFHNRAVVVCADLTAALPRFGRYSIRLTNALERSKAGELEYITDSTASYQAVWFQLHEDLLFTLGIPRQ